MLQSRHLRVLISVSGGFKSLHVEEKWEDWDPCVKDADRTIPLSVLGGKTGQQNNLRKSWDEKERWTLGGDGNTHWVCRRGDVGRPNQSNQTFNCLSKHPNMVPPPAPVTPTACHHRPHHQTTPDIRLYAPSEHLRKN